MAAACREDHDIAGLKYRKVGVGEERSTVVPAFIHSLWLGVGCGVQSGPAVSLRNPRTAQPSPVAAAPHVLRA